MNLISAKNEQKAVVALANTLPIKQQLLMKLGAAMGSSDGQSIGGNSSGGDGNISSHSSPHGNVNASPTGGGLVQQLLPLRLSESLEHKRASPKVPSSTDYLNDFYGSIQIQTQFEQFQSTGQQNCRFCCRLQPNGKQSGFYSDAQHKTSSLPHNNNNIVSASAGSMHSPKIFRQTGFSFAAASGQGIASITSTTSWPSSSPPSPSPTSAQSSRSGDKSRNCFPLRILMISRNKSLLFSRLICPPLSFFFKNSIDPILNCFLCFFVDYSL
jgi:hypothetical protein